MLHPIFNSSARNTWIGLMCAGGLLLAGCAPAAAPLTPTPEPDSPPPTAAPVEHLKLVLAPDGNEVRYLVQEQFADQDLPSKAIGATSAITGQIVLGVDGAIVADDSLFVVDLKTLKTDQRERDKWVGAYYLQTHRFPSAEFRPAEAIGLAVPLPLTGEVAFQLSGEMSVHGVTQLLTWDVTGEIRGQELVGRAVTGFRFGDFDVTVPRAPFLLSVEDHVAVELDFRLVLEGS